MKLKHLTKINKSNNKRLISLRTTKYETNMPLVILFKTKHLRNMIFYFPDKHINLVCL